MATLQSSIQLFDGFSKPLNNIYIKKGGEIWQLYKVAFSYLMDLVNH